MSAELTREAQRIQDFLEITCSADINEMLGRLTDLNVYMARSGQMLADAICLQEEAIKREFSEHHYEISKMSPTIAKEFIKSAVSEENKLVKWLDRINRSCIHQSENLRTQISFEKQNLEMTRRGY